MTYSTQSHGSPKFSFSEYGNITYDQSFFIFFYFLEIEMLKYRSIEKCLISLTDPLGQESQYFIESLWGKVRQVCCALGSVGRCQVLLSGGKKINICIMLVSNISWWLL